MSDHTIPPNDADLILHRFVTERVPVRAFFVSADGSVRAKLDGFVSSSTRAAGLHIVTDLRLDGPISAFMTFSRISGSRCEYQDETQVPEEFELVNGLRLTLPNGDILIIAERRAKKPEGPSTHF